MAADPGSNNLDDFDIEQVINWDEHNYASKNLEFQQLPDLDLPTDVPTSAPAAVPTTPTSVNHGGGVMMRPQVLTPRHPQVTHQQGQDQSTGIIGMSQPAHTSVLNPVFPQDAGCIITDIRRELGSSSNATQRRTTISPTFPSETFDLPPLTHPHSLIRTSGPGSMSFMPRHTSQVGRASQLVHSIPPHQAMHSGIQGFHQPSLPTPLPSMPVDETLAAGIGEEGDDGSIDKLIEDIVDRDLPQGLGDPIVFHQESQPMSLGNQHMPRQMGQVIQSSSSPMMPMVHSPVTSQSIGHGSPMGGSTSRGGGVSLCSPSPLASSPLGQKPASPHAANQPVKVPSPQIPQGGVIQQHKSTVALTNAPKPAMKLPSQSKPASPQTMQMGMPTGQVQSPMGMSSPQVQSPRPHPQSVPVGLSSGSVQSPRLSPQNAGVVLPSGQVQSPRPSPQNAGIGISSVQVQSPRPVQQNNTMGALQNTRQMTSGPLPSPRSVPQRSPQHMGNIMSPSVSQSSGPPTPNVLSPMSQMSPLKMPPASPMGNMQMPQSPVQSPMNIPSPQTTRPPQQLSPQMSHPPQQPSPGLRQGNQVVSKGKDVAKMQAQAGISQGGTEEHSKVSCRPHQAPSASKVSQITATPRTQSTVMPVSGGKPMQKLISTMPTKPGSSKASKPAQAKTAIPKVANTSQAPATKSSAQIAGHTTKASQSKILTTSTVTRPTIDSATAQNILKGLGSLKGANFIPLTLKQGGSQPIQAVQLPANSPNANLLKQAMLLQAAVSSSASQTITTGQPVSVSTSKGQVIYYVLPKGSTVNTGASSKVSGTASTSGQSLKMIVINAKTPVTVNKQVAPPVDAAASVPLTQTLSSGGISTIKPVGIGSLKTPVASVVKNVGNNNIVMSTVPMSTMSNGSTIMSTGQEPEGFTGSISPAFTQPRPSVPLNIGGSASAGSQVPGMLMVPVSGPSNPATVGHIQTAGTTQITFVNESTGVRQYMASSGDDSSHGGNFKGHFQNHTSSIDAPRVTATMQPQKAVKKGDDNDSDTPLAELAETLKKNGDEKKKKKKKKGEKRKKKDKLIAELPKPLSAYQLFFKESQAAIRQQNPAAQFGEIAKIVGQMWENLPEDQRKVYVSKHEKEKAEYQKAVDELKLQQEATAAKIRKLEGASSLSDAQKIPTPKFYGTSAVAAPVKDALKIPAVKEGKEALKAPGARKTKDSLRFPAVKEVKDSSKGSTMKENSRMETEEESSKGEGIKIKIPKTAVSSVDKSEGVASSKPSKPSSVSSVGSKVSSANSLSSAAAPPKKKSKMAINPIAQRVCIRDGCNMPARTTKDRGTQYCSNECTVKHCRIVFNAWVSQRRAEVS